MAGRLMERVGVEDKFQVVVAVVMFKEVRQGLTFLAGDAGQEDVAGQGRLAQPSHVLAFFRFFRAQVIA